MLDQGRVVASTRTEEAIRTYMSLTSGGNEAQKESFSELIDPVISCKVHWGADAIRYGENLSVKSEIECREKEGDCSVRVLIYDEALRLAAEWSSLHHGCRYPLEKGLNTLAIDIKSVQLRPGSYHLSFLVYDSRNLKTIIWHHLKHTLNVGHTYTGAATYQLS